jgi:hypothetical protein
VVIPIGNIMIAIKTASPSKHNDAVRSIGPRVEGIRQPALFQKRPGQRAKPMVQTKARCEFSFLVQTF